MATSSDLVNAAYLNLYRAPPTAADAAIIAQSLSFSDTPTGSVVPTDIAVFVRNATSTTAVAVMSYGFFTGATLGTAGLDYLLSPSGANPNNLNSNYYAVFDTENRYINFGKNLGLAGEGSAAFASAYGGLTLAQTVVKAYGAIFGSVIGLDYAASVLAAPVSDGKGGTFTRADYFAYYGGDGLAGQGTKAATVGWLLGEAAKMYRGPLYTAAQAYMADLAGDGVAQSGVDLLAAYSPGGAYGRNGPNDPGLPGRTFTITADELVFLSTGTKSQMVSLTGGGQDYSTSGNDVVTSTSGLAPSDALVNTGSFAFPVGLNLGPGNDVLTVTGGFASARIDMGEGDNTARFSAFNGELFIGPGYSQVTVDAFSSQGADRSGRVFTPAVYDFVRGHDVLTVTSAFGSGRLAATDVRGSVSLDAALAAIAAATPAGTNAVFEYGGSTFVFHQNADAAVNIGATAAADGLLKLVGVTGATVGAAGGAGDVLFGG